jgi:YebC/PmpR family DNA-binding regulatory protein
MSGHSKWSTIKRKKGATDAKRGRIFTRLIREITTAARLGGGDPTGNPKLRTALDAAKAQNMPGDNIEKAIKRGTGELEGVTYDEISYEGYGPHGVAIMVRCLTDNKNRTVSAIRHIFSRYNGSMAESGSVGWMFHRKGLITLLRDQIDENKLMELVLDFDVDDIASEDDVFEIIMPPESFDSVLLKLKENELKVESAEISHVAENTVPLKGDDAETVINLLSALEEDEDVQDVVSNFNMIS